MVVIPAILTRLVLQKKELQAISTEILDSFTNPSEKMFSMVFGAFARIVKDCKSEDKHGMEFVMIIGASTILSSCKAQSRVVGLVCC